MILFLVLCVAAAAYQATALVAVLLHWRKRCPVAVELPPVSILKPVAGADAGFAPAIRSHAQIDYPRFEILFGVAALDDPAVSAIEALQYEFPNVDIRIVQCAGTAPNAKVAKLETLACVARYPVYVVSDADISVPADYLRYLVAELQQAGLVTCLYRASGGSFPTRFEALGIATDFAPSALVAPLTGVNEFGLGSTLAFRSSTLERAGRFPAIREYIADDYQLGKRISSLGLKVLLSRIAVETWLGDGSWADVWRHQVRWARTIRLSRHAYLGLPITFATVWAGIATAAGWWWIAAGLLSLRMAVALACGAILLRDPLTFRWWWLVPLRDLWGAAVWVAGAFGKTVEWGGRTLRLDRAGRIVSG